MVKFLVLKNSDQDPQWNQPMRIHDFVTRPG